MKKIILLSMIASGMLLASSVTNLTTNIDNEISNGSSAGLMITDANISQGHTIVSGDSDINGLYITETANTITDTTVSSATVTQGLTDINSGTVNNSSLTSTNTISGSAITTEATVNQGSTIVNDGAELEDTEVISENVLMGIVENGSKVSQATLELNGEGTELDGKSIIKTTNTIVANIDDSEVHQARVRIGGGYKVSALNISETNNLLSNVTAGSTVIQGGLDVCSHGGDASDWCED